MHPLERYRSIVPDWKAFESSWLLPLPTSFWINNLRIPASRLLEIMGKEGLSIQQIPWISHCYKTDSSQRLGQTWFYRAGLIHILEEVSMLPAMLMDCKAGERILDLCAAPGNKTMLLAGMLQGKGALIANEFNRGRLAVLRSHLERLGVPGVSTFQHNGTNLNGNFGAFDRILCDVPCSCEGTHRKHGKEISWGNPDFRSRLTSTQRALLRKALQLCKVGGRIVYSTCTYAPEENEMVVDAILKEYPGLLRVLPISVPGLEMDAGILEWKGQRLDPQVERCGRVYPHRNNTGGFFVAILEKTDTLPAWSNVVEIPNQSLHLAEEDRATIQETRNQIQAYFGLPDTCFAPFEFFLHSGDLFGVYSQPRLPLEPPPVSCGIMFLRKTINHPKMPTGFSNLLAPFATRMVVELTDLQRDAFMAREKLVLPEEQLERCPEDGYVMIRFEGIGIGQGTLDRRSGTPVLHSLFPKFLA